MMPRDGNSGNNSHTMRYPSGTLECTAGDLHVAGHTGHARMNKEEPESSQVPPILCAMTLKRL